MEELAGTWDLRMRTPVGTIAAVYRFTETAGIVTGTADSGREVVAVTDVMVDGRRATWRQSVTKPMRLNLTFDVTVRDGVLNGHSRAGRLPRTEVTGTRRAD
jgi:hypothetical protein